MAEEEGSVPRAKRPRVGRFASEILDTIELDTPAKVDKSERRGILDLLLYLGRPSKNESLMESMKSHAMQLGNAYRFSEQLTLECLFECIENLAGHTPLLATAVATMHKTTPQNIASSTVDRAVTRLHQALEIGDMTRIRLLLRFIASLAGLGVVSQSEYQQQMVDLLSAASRKEQREGHAIVYAVLASLPWMANTGGSPLDTSAAGSADGIAALLQHAANALDQLHIPSAAASVASAHALSGEHGSESCFSWHSPIDAHPGDATRLGANLAALAAPPARALLGILQTSFESGGLPGLAVPSIARPQDDVALCKYMSSATQPVRSVEEGQEGKEDSGLDAVSAASKGTGEEATMDDGSSSVSAPVLPRAANGASIVSMPRVTSYAGGWALTHAAGRQHVPGAACALPALPAHGRWYVRSYLTIFGPGGLSGSPTVMRYLGLDTPTATPLALWAVREVAADVAACTAPLHVEAAKALLHLPMGRGRDAVAPFSGTALAVETVLAQMMALPTPPASASYYTVLLLDMFRVDADRLERDRDRSGGAIAAPANAGLGIVPSTLALAMRVLWKYMPLLDDAVADRLASWLAHHVSNTQFAWPWAEWVAALSPSVPASDPQKRFLTALLEKTFALVGPYHYDRIVKECFPQEYAASGLLPTKSTDAAQSTLLSSPPALPFSSPVSLANPAGTGEVMADGTGQDIGGVALDNPASPTPTRVPAAPALRALAAAITTKLKGKVSSEGMKDWMAGAPEAVGVSAEGKLMTFCHALLIYGKANLKNAATLFERYKDLVCDAEAWGISVADMASLGVLHSSAPHALPRSGHASTVQGACVEVLLSAIETVWQREPNVASAVTDLAVVAGLATLEDVVRFCLEPATTLADHHAHVEGLTRTDRLLPAHRIGARTLQPRNWALVHSTLERGRAMARLAAVELALYRGSRIFDLGPKDYPEPEEWEDEAAAKDDSLLLQARVSRLAYTQAVHAAVEQGVRAARALQAHLAMIATADASITNTPDLLDQPAVIAELLRVSLANTRHVCRSHADVVSSAASRNVLVRILESTTHLIGVMGHADGAVHDPRSSAADASFPFLLPHTDLAGALVQAAMAYVPSTHAMVPALKRDAMVPQPVPDEDLS